MVLEKVPLILQSRPDRLALFDIPLTSVDDGNVTESQGDNPAGEDIDDIGSLVPASFSKRKRKQNMLSPQIEGLTGRNRLDSHEIDLGQHPDRPRPLRIHIPGHLQPIRIRQIRIRRRHSQDDRIRLADKL